MLFSCKEKSGPTVERTGSYMTQQSENITIVNSLNGHVSYRAFTPLMERYEYASEPYSEYRKGVEVTTYNDSTHMVESTLVANYAIYLETQDLWEAKGNVVATNAKGQKLETEQLFWDRKEKRIYSKVDSKITEGEDVVIGSGFESDEEMKELVITNARGRVNVDVTPGPGDSTETAQPLSSDLKPQPGGPGDMPAIREGEAVARPHQNDR